MFKPIAKSLRFTHVHLENWKNFTLVDVDLQNRVFLVGPNASGKSNLQDVFRFLQEIVSVGGGFRQAVAGRGGVSHLRCLAARRYPDIAIGVRVGKEGIPAAWEYELRFTQDNQRRPIIQREIVRQNGETILDRPDQKDNDDGERLTQTHIEQVLANQDFRDLVDFFASVRYLHIVPQLVRDPDRSGSRQNDPFGGDFLEQIASTQTKTQKSRLKRIREVLRIAVPQLQELELERDSKGRPHLRGKYEHWRPHGAWQSEKDFSDGTLRVLGLLWAMLAGNGPLLLEEPELSLHPEVVRFVPQMFARLQHYSGRQIFVSTHSTDLLRDDGIGLDEVLLLEPSPEGTKVSPACEFGEIRALLQNGVSLAEAAMPRTRPRNADQLTFAFMRAINE